MVARVSEGETMESPVVSLVLWSSLFGTVVAWLIGSLIRDMQGAEIRSFISKSLTWQVSENEGVNIMHKLYSAMWGVQFWNVNSCDVVMYCMLLSLPSACSSLYMHMCMHNVHPASIMEIIPRMTNQVLRQVEYEELGLALTGSIALYFLGTVEPVIGSSKLASLLVMTAGVSFILFLPGMVFTLYDNKVWHQKLVPSSGPLPGIFALYVVYWLVIPIHRPYAFGMLGISFSEKAPIYLLGVQLFFSGGWNSIFPSIAGILCGAAWVSDVHGMQHVRIPLLKSLVNCLAGMDSDVDLLHLTYNICLLSFDCIPCLL